MLKDFIYEALQITSWAYMHIMTVEEDLILLNLGKPPLFAKEVQRTPATETKVVRIPSGAETSFLSTHSLGSKYALRFEQVSKQVCYDIG